MFTSSTEVQLNSFSLDCNGLNEYENQQQTKAQTNKHPTKQANDQQTTT